MGEETKIGWTDHTANFWIGCQKWSPGCLNCYAEVDTPVRVHRAKGLELWGPPKTTPRYRAKGVWKKVLKWDRAAREAGERRRVFAHSLSDFFEDHPMLVPWRAEALALLASCTNLDVQLLTKRPENIRSMVPPLWLAPGGWPRHVWVGTTVEDQKRAEERIDHLLRVPAWVRFLSCEPLLEEVDLDPPRCQHCGRYDVVLADDGATPLCPHCSGPEYRAEMGAAGWLDDDAGPTWPGINHVIVGGESGPGHRPLNVDWVRKIVGQCREAGVAVFVKQDSGARAGMQGRIPDDLWIKEFPSVE